MRAMREDHGATNYDLTLHAQRSLAARNSKEQIIGSCFRYKFTRNSEEIKSNSLTWKSIITLREHGLKHRFIKYRANRS